ncbi:PEGA domain-containing protein [Vibrio sp. V39_P1S14PM300]|uniref:PEGA domain-containing protein n=1 Tax=Vibrio sp. V39_P1S14PM300 TaxID=1938690 RepID=UPI0013736D94|nr:PEGA domain-containing protein [Vibrio sp. V39_P1S14PM300]NAX21252.1 PEGA domain-containing protein [Vibrio sp. V39_P1S14PM300]
MRTRRIPALLLALSPLWVSPSILAQDSAPNVDAVSAIDGQLTDKQSQIDSVTAELSTQSNHLQQLKNEQSALAREGQQLASELTLAKSTLDKQYAKMLEDPETELTSFQSKYKQSWAALNDNQAAQQEKQQAIADAETQLSQIQQKQTRLKGEFSVLKEQRITARVNRLAQELRQQEVVTTAYTTTCSVSMTLGECANQGQYLTKQQAVNSFSSKLIEHLTEAPLARQNLKGVQLNIHIQESQLLSSGFKGNDQYATEMQVQLQAKPDRSAACTLLGVDERYCVQQGSVPSGVDKQDKKWANVTFRSNQFNDQVTINGIGYGSTPIEVVLPSGQHKVSVTKEGYKPYNRVITIHGNDTVWVTLAPNTPS